MWDHESNQYWTLEQVFAFIDQQERAGDDSISRVRDSQTEEQWAHDWRRICEAVPEKWVEVLEAESEQIRVGQTVSWTGSYEIEIGEATEIEGEGEKKERRERERERNSRSRSLWK